MSTVNNDPYKNNFSPYEGSLVELHSDAIPKGFENSFLKQYDMQDAAKKLIGDGQFKAVYLLMNKDGKKIAQQQAPLNKFASSIERTAKILQSLKLHGTVKIHGIHKEDGKLNIMTKFYNQGDLEAYAKDLPEHEKLELLVEACKAVQELNTYGIQHRDIKANNFLVHRKKNDKIKVALSDPDCMQGKVKKNTLFNSLLAPPELLDSDSTHDLWMCGLMAVMLLTDKSEKDLPWVTDFENKDFKAVKHLKQELKGFFDGIDDPKIKAACQKAMHPDNTMRGTIGQFISSLQEAINES